MEPAHTTILANSPQIHQRETHWVNKALNAIVAAKLAVISPESLREKFADVNYTIDAVYGNYGYTPYG